MDETEPLETATVAGPRTCRPPPGDGGDFPLDASAGAAPGPPGSPTSALNPRGRGAPGAPGMPDLAGRAL
jgi:hypothetical protein